MKKIFKNLLLFTSLALLFTSCGEKPSENPTDTGSTVPTVEPTIEPTVEPTVEPTPEPEPVWVDYVAQTKLDLTDTTKAHQEVSVFNYVDGDTTHFVPKGEITNWPEDTFDEKGRNVLKARYNSCDTPESTGKIEPWGNAAKKFTRHALETAHSIILQSDKAVWETDSTGTRFLCWVWYQPSATEDYKLLNLELVQEGLAKLKSASNFSLYETFNATNMQSILFKKPIYSDEKDPNFYYGKAIQIDMKELRTNIDTYLDKKVAVNGLVTVYDSFRHTAYAEAYDDETNRSYGIDLYLGFNTYEIIKVGNLCRFVGTVTYYENGDNFQLSGLSYHRMNPDYEGSMKLLEKNVPVEAKEITSAELSKKPNEDGLVLGELSQATYVKIGGLKVVNVYTTESTNTMSNGALTLTCKDANDVTVIIRTSVLYKAQPETPENMLKAEDVLYKHIEATGIVTKFEGKVQIHVYTLNELKISA